ncbi:MAG: HD domain-containing protein [Bacteroidales bacterium]|nr:HD domain-containing protein [Bacteroidales bacterium]MDD3431334.1 HD domain-containing protein [Bacteroidales bacterium]MDD4361899.1 HD domain-containing protein [Bacteroidales bacterium]
MNLSEHIKDAIFILLSEAADEINVRCCLVGGYVRDIFLKNSSQDIDIVTVGKGIELAEFVAAKLGKSARVNVFKNFGTAQLRFGSLELEFVGARKESYQRHSRKPIVEDGSLEEDLLRRDFTINAMAISLNKADYGELIDPFDGRADLKKKILRTPCDPDLTFSDDPLRMMRALRFATSLQFSIHPETFEAIRRNRERISIVSAERISDEMQKMMMAERPSEGFRLMERSGLLDFILPELAALKGVETKDGKGHKDNFLHTLAVLDKVAEQSKELYLRWAALFHDIAKPMCKRWDDKLGWTFHNHNYLGEKKIPGIFRRLKLPMNEHMKYVQKLVGLHMRPIALVEEEVSDSAVRRLLFDAGDDIEDLMLLCEADITSKNPVKVQRFLENFQLVRQKMIDLEERDRIRNMQPPVSGEEIMSTFGLAPGKIVGEIKSSIKDAILDGLIPNEYEAAREFMLQKARELGLEAYKQEGSSS